MFKIPHFNKIVLIIGIWRLFGIWILGFGTLYNMLITGGGQLLERMSNDQ
jgi:hypothetical protein